MHLRTKLFLACLPLLVAAGYASAVGYQQGYLRRLVGPITVDGDLTVTDDLVVTDDATVTTLTFAGGGTPCLTRGGNTTVQTCSGDGFASLGTLQGQGAGDIWGDFRNTANGANCSSNTAAACTNDTGGDCTADGAGNTVSCTRTDGAISLLSTDSTGTPGAATINKPSGRSAIAALATSVVITNSTVAATSNIQITPLDRADTECVGYYVSAVGAGSFTVTCPVAAVTATWKFMWIVHPAI